MSTPFQKDRRAFQVAAATPAAAIAAIRERAQAIHPEDKLYLEVVGEANREGLFTVVADYWSVVLDTPE